MIVFACGGEKSNINRRNFARSYFCGLLIAVVIAIVLVIFGIVFASSGIFRLIPDIDSIISYYL